jgi:hypothetical protein
MFTLRIGLVGRFNVRNHTLVEIKEMKERRTNSSSTNHVDSVLEDLMGKKVSQKQEKKEPIVGISADFFANPVFSTRVGLVPDSNQGQSPQARPCDSDTSKNVGEKSQSKIISDCGRCSDQIGCGEWDSRLCRAEAKEEISKT